MKGILKKGQRYKIFIHLLYICISLMYIFPLMLVVSASFSSEAALARDGFSLLPREFTTEAYKAAFANGKRVLRAYGVTISFSVIGTIVTLLSAGLTSYAISRPYFAYRKFVTKVVFFTMLFSGGSISGYIITTKYYHLGNTFWVYIAGALCGGAWNILMMRSFIQGIPDSLFESAKIDGASERVNFFRIAVPLSKPVLATVGFLTLVGNWNNWYTSLIYIRDSKLFSLQYLLQEILNNAKMIQEMSKKAVTIHGGMSNVPTESMKYALCVIAAGPMLLAFPFFQKYFVKGTTIGAVKG